MINASGRIVSFADYHVVSYDGEWEVGVRIDLDDSHFILAEERSMLIAIANAVKAQGATDLEVGAYLAVRHVGHDGVANLYEAEYMRPGSVGTT